MIHLRKLNRLFLVCFLIFIGQSVIASTPRNLLQKQGDAQFLKTILLPKEKWIPYPAYNNRAGWDKLFKNEKTDIISEGERFLSYEWKVIKATDYMEFSLSGSRSIMEQPYNKNINAVYSLFLAEMAEGKGRFINQLMNGIFNLCEMTTWAASAHLSIQLNHKKFPDHKQQIIDLVSGDIGSMFSWIYYFLHTEFDKREPLISERMQYELERRIMQPYMTQDHFWWMGFGKNPNQMVNNWNPWCNSNVLQVFALMENDPDKLSKAVYRTMLSVDKFINYNKDDGACEEGPSYWGHAAGKMYDYLQILYDITGGKISIFNDPLVKKMGEYISRSYVGNNWVVNFADASAKGGKNAPLIYRYGKAVGSAEMEAFAAYLIENNKDELKIAAGRDMFRTLQGMLYNDEIKNIKPALPSEAFTWYPQTEFCYMKSKNFFFAAKGGYNDESHNHNDVGTFCLYIDTIPFFIDAGVGTYTRQTFSSERYSIWTMQSNYHNLPEINGQQQQYGLQYKAKNVSFNPKQQKLSMDISGAYSKDADVKSWQRSYTFSDKGLLINDAYELLATNEPLKFHFLVWSNPKMIKPGTLSFEREGKTVLMNYDFKKLDLSTETISLKDRKLSEVWGDEVVRVTFISKRQDLKGSYNFIISKGK